VVDTLPGKISDTVCSNFKEDFNIDGVSPVNSRDMLALRNVIVSQINSIKDLCLYPNLRNNNNFVDENGVENSHEWWKFF
jgi:hypothetical protein